ncbi:VWA domain-containing protein [Methylomarinum vadi]|uniref:VWA domain-containing protein n=1 Tax=Methylomarinum vadi TaxID=438855 RepID=UPI0004DF0362|nr:VWA domain-containing protein [Methylomarinum vadi]
MIIDTSTSFVRSVKAWLVGGALVAGLAVPVATMAGQGSVSIDTKLSQSKLVQSGDNIVYLNVTIRPSPQHERISERRATDLLLLLDRSGSMSEARKMPYAKAAIREVLGRLDGNDRFALVTFSDQAVVASHWLNVDAANRYHLDRLVEGVSASGGTNMGEGLQAVLRLLQYGDSERVRKVLLLSDGQANQGITHPDLLANMATQATRYGAVMSTIGMGLGFNERLLAKLADYGMGHYSYLEDLSGLAAILNRDLQDSRRLYASRSTLEIRLGEGVQLVDAGGYPLSRGGSTVTITTGQLLSNTAKHFVITLRVPNVRTGSLTLGDLRLNYRVDGETLQAVPDRQLTLSVVAPERRDEARQSIDREVYRQSWLENNLGRAKKQLGRWLREGKREQAEQVIGNYKRELKEAERDSAIELASPAVNEALQQMESQVDEAFSGSLQEQHIKQNRAAKSLQYEAIKQQRK